MSWFDVFALINLGCVFLSGWVAVRCFNRGDSTMGWFNVFASSLNAGIFMNHFR